MAAPLIVRLVMDAAGYLKTVDTAVASNTKLEQSSLGVGEAMQVSATKSVQASLRATEALQTQVAGYRELAASAEQSAAVRERAALLANRAESRLNSQLGLTSVGLAGTSKASKTAERDLGKTTRGLIAGSGAATGLGRSLAFASTGFLAVAAGSTIIKSGISEALTLAATQRQVDAQLKTSGKTWAQYGARVDAVDLRLSHVSGFTNQELLQSFGYLVRVTGNVSTALKLDATAADVARGRHISLSTASIALAKALGGSATALKRLGITIPANVKGMAALNYVSAKFAGQAKAGATVGDRFHATLVDTEEIIGTALLPTFTRLTTELEDYLAKMNESGRLQSDVNETVSTAGTVFHALGDIIGTVDQVTGSFKNTFEALLAAFVLSKVITFANALEVLAAKWGLVSTAATAAAAAQTAALAEGEAAGAVGGATGTAFVSRRTARSLPSVFGQYAGTGSVTTRARAVGADALAIVSTPAFAVLIAAVLAIVEKRLNEGQHGFTKKSLLSDVIAGPSAGLGQALNQLSDVIRGTSKKIAAVSFTRQAQGKFAFAGFPKDLQFLPSGRTAAAPASPFGTATPIAIYAKYTQTISEQIAVAQAALTKTTQDDVAIAKAIIARIKSQIDKGHLAGVSLIQALQDEATQQGVLDNARQQAAQQAAAIAAAKKAAASSYTTPIDLQLAEARAQLTKSTADDIRVEKEILAAARAALNSGKKNKQGQLAALQVILQAQQTIQSFTGQSDTTFTEPLKLQLALAKAQATGGNQTAILLKMKAALERALKSAHGNILKQIDIYNQIAAINQQLGADANTAFGNYKQASLAAETAGLGLTHAQQKALEARLSQRGPGGTIPGSGTGAGGYIIGPDGRPIQVHRHRRPGRGRDAGGTDGGPRKLQATFNIRIYLDGRDVTRSVTIRQQRTRDRNPPQTRGAHAGKSSA